MKRISVISLAGVLFLAACGNNNSSTVGTYESDEAPSSGAEEHAAREKTANTETENARTVSIDTAKNITGISKDSATSKSKKDTSLTAKKKYVKVQKTKKVDDKP